MVMGQPFSVTSALAAFIPALSAWAAAFSALGWVLILAAVSQRVEVYARDGMDDDDDEARERKLYILAALQAVLSVIYIVFFAPLLSAVQWAGLILALAVCAYAVFAAAGTIVDASLLFLLSSSMMFSSIRCLRSVFQ